MLAAFLAPRFAGCGTALSVVTTELAVCAMLVATVMRTTRLFRRQNLIQSDAARLQPALAAQTGSACECSC
jgi:hypothetical protein